jgi:hypothetical protein
MEISKHVNSKILTNFFFVKGKVSLDFEYFKNKIDEGIEEKNNNNFKTNVLGKMTSWKYFIEDKKFIQFLLPIIQYVNDNNLSTENFKIREAWGIKEGFANCTSMHDHAAASWSGVLYLSDANQPLIFPKINEEVEAKAGNFAIFSSYIKHGTKHMIYDDSIKYGISFNLARHVDY